MKFNWRKLVPTITWKKDDTKQELIDLLFEFNDINKGLNLAVGYLNKDITSLKNEAIALLTAIVLIHNNQLDISSDFCEAALDPNISLTIEKMYNGDVLLKIKENKDEEVCEDERNK